MKYKTIPTDENVKWNEEDLKPHQGIGAVIKGPKPGEILLQKHTKLKLWTIPVGKGRQEEASEDVLKRELKEELGIDVKHTSLLGTEGLLTTRNNKKMRIPTYLYLVNKYDGDIQNLEPHKHEIQEFKDPQKLVLDGEPISHALTHWLRHARKQK